MSSGQLLFHTLQGIQNKVQERCCSALYKNTIARIESHTILISATIVHVLCLIGIADLEIGAHAS